MGASTLLRTLTVKSTMGFGKHIELKVGQLLDLKEKNYLRWCYFNLSRISFTEDILTAIGITDEFRITKPGKDADAGTKLEDFLRSLKPEFVIERGEKRINKINAAKRAKNHVFESKRFSKANLTRLNHGH